MPGRPELNPDFRNAKLVEKKNDPAPPQKIKAWDISIATKKGSITNLETSEWLEFQFNPPTFGEKFSADYARHTIPGLGYQVLQYIATNNNQITLELYMSSVVSNYEETSAADPFDIEDAKDFLQSLLYPVRTPAGGWTAPPELLFVWPKAIRMNCVAVDLKFEHQKFSLGDSRTIVYMASLTLEELVTGQRTSQTVRRNGSRSSARGS